MDDATSRRVVDVVVVRHARATGGVVVDARDVARGVDARARGRRGRDARTAMWILWGAVWVFGTPSDASAIETWTYPRALVGSFKGNWWLDASTSSSGGAGGVHERRLATRDVLGDASVVVRRERERAERDRGDCVSRGRVYRSRGRRCAVRGGVRVDDGGGVRAPGRRSTPKEVLSATNESEWMWTTWQGASAYRESLRAVASDVLGEGRCARRRRCIGRGIRFRERRR